MAEESNSYLEKITPKDLVFFSPETRKVIAKNDFSYLGVDYDVNLPKDSENIKVWGLPYLSIDHPVSIGLVGGLISGYCRNGYKMRPMTSNVWFYGASFAVWTAATYLFQDQMDKYRVDRELVTWDYVKKHPQDFPEVFNPPKKYKDMVLPWNVCR